MDFLIVAQDAARTSSLTEMDMDEWGQDTYFRTSHCFSLSAHVSTHGYMMIDRVEYVQLREIF